MKLYLPVDSHYHATHWCRSPWSIPPARSRHQARPTRQSWPRNSRLRSGTRSVAMRTWTISTTRPPSTARIWSGALRTSRPWPNRSLRTSRACIFLGGEHSLTPPIIRGLAATLAPGERLGVLFFDTHGDLRDTLWGTPVAMPSPPAYAASLNEGPSSRLVFVVIARKRYCGHENSRSPCLDPRRQLSSASASGNCWRAPIAGTSRSTWMP